MDVLDFFVSPKLRMNGAKLFECVVDVRDGNESVLEVSGKEVLIGEFEFFNFFVVADVILHILHDGVRRRQNDESAVE